MATREGLDVHHESHEDHRPGQPDYGMWQNLPWATGYNLVAIPLAAGELASAGIVLSPAVGAVLMSASTIVVALNAQLLRRVRLDPAELAGV